MGRLGWTVLAAGLAFGTGPAWGQVTQGEFDLCGRAAVKVGAVCMDQFEASVWDIPEVNAAGRSNSGVVKKIRKGKATLIDLQEADAALATPSSCAEDGGDCRGRIFAVSVPGVIPTVGLSWWQAQQACANSGGRLPTNAEWQMAVAGTPDNDTDDGTTTCNIAAMGMGDGLVSAGRRTACVSAWGVYDLVGNAAEWVADWIIDPVLPSVQQGITRGGDARSGAIAGASHVGVTASLCGGADDDQFTPDPLIGLRCVH